MRTSSSTEPDSGAGIPGCCCCCSACCCSWPLPLPPCSSVSTGDSRVFSTLAGFSFGGPPSARPRRGLCAALRLPVAWGPEDPPWPWLEAASPGV